MPALSMGPFRDTDGYQRALELDRADPLAGFRERFFISDPETIYLDGNSLGRLPEEAPQSIQEVTTKQWGDRLIRSWNEGWWEMQLEVGDLLAPVLGASPGEVIISDSTSVNLYKLASAAIHARPGRPKIVTDDLNFPTDVYILEGLAEQTGSRLEVIPSDGIHGPVDGLIEAIDKDTSLVALSHTVFKSGYTYDIAAITALAHNQGALVLWDTSHSVGSMPVALNRAGADLAVGCTYKYLNGGPGSPAFLYVRSDLQDQLRNPITAWWGHAEPFAFDLHFRPVEGVRRFHTGTMPILSLAAAEAGIRGVVDAGIDRIRAKSVSLTKYLVEQWRSHLDPLGFRLASPVNPEHRGSHISLAHDEAWPMARALIDVGKVIPDFRAPDNLRLGLSPLYTTHVEIHTAVQRLRRIVEAGSHRSFDDYTAEVT